MQRAGAKIIDYWQNACPPLILSVGPTEKRHKDE